ncbi:4-hydroxyacetophenone monooxygenase [Oceanibacterium hippocampi]|uniref:4-hydroxyacetophenone monooxygenase n=2 Tax=Oceanibacterium hippocampi TaxID=745714 RepID=A0A1Y5TMK9_9PROT|nr:4-hydroxyacetophenone monooxygenase [Oceanibacterium hippocampi]
MIGESDATETRVEEPLPVRNLVDAVSEADLRVLLMVVFHLTGDPKWLDAPFRPKRDVKLIADEDAGLSPEASAEIRGQAVALLSDPERQPAIDDPGNELMVRMMSACLGEAVPPEYAPMMREEMGLCRRQVDWSGEAPAALESARPVIIAGAGASGIALAANLETLGIPYRIVDKNDDVGGTWFENVYPGCGVDTPNHAYSFSFGKPYRWSRYFAPRREIYDYLRRCADEAGVRRKVEFRTRVSQADWDETEQCWRVRIEGPQGGELLQGSALVSAIGQLSLPSVPEIPGMETFEGPVFHSSAWPDDLELSGRDVAVVGTGASAMQIVPSIVDRVKSLTVYQRSPQWARPIPRYHDPIGTGAQWLLERVPYYAAWYRFAMLWRYGDGLLPTLRKDPNWDHPERSLNRINDRHREEMTKHIVRELGDRQDLLKKCIPNYPAYGKRILLDNGWYGAITRPNAELVTDNLLRITADGLIAGDNNFRKAEVIVLATGFKVGLMAARLNVTGRSGRRLAEAWHNDNPTAHLGITVPGFPNFFCMQGPNTGLGHGGSAIFQAECQARYIAGSLVRMFREDIAAIDVKQTVHDEYVRRVDAEHEAMIWTHPGMSTYYRNRQGRVISVMPWRLVDYWAMTHEPDFDDYHLTFRDGGRATE